MIKNLNAYSQKLGDLIPQDFIFIPIRISLFLIFWKSVQTKIEGLTFFGQHFAFWNVNSSTMTLFAYEYSVPFIPYEIAAYTATISEFFFSILVLIGLFTCFSALGLLIITVVIQLFVYPEAWQTHLVWVAMLLVLIKQGAGKWGVDAIYK